MINARFMYLRPGNLFKDFVVESNTQVVTASGRVANTPKGDGSKIIRGCLAESTKEQKESHSTRDRVCTHTIVQAGSPEAKKMDEFQNEYVVNPFKPDAYFDFDLFKKHVLHHRPGRGR